MKTKLMGQSVCCGIGAQAAAADQTLQALKGLSVDQLLDIQVTSVSKRSEALSDAPASIYVITSESIRRSGVTTLPEALRLAPNLQVARADSAQYAISARGFNNAIGNKLLVLIDGRTASTTGVEVLPSIRLGWKLDDTQLLWGSLSRAVRAPARYDRDVRFPGTPPFLVIGGPNFESEVANVAELGFRAQPVTQLSYSITAFLHRWDKVRSGTGLPVQIEDKIEGDIYGIEAWAEYRPFEFWEVSAGVNAVKEHLQLKRGSTDPVGVDNETLRNDPDYVWMARSRFDLGRHTRFDLQWRRVAALPAPVVPACSELDARLAWLPSESLEISLVGRNLLHDSHPEFGNIVSRSEYVRCLYGQVRWQF